MADGKVFISNVNTLAALCDRLSIENHKVAYFENKKREEQKSADPCCELIAEWDNASRDACELRSLIKREIDELFQYVVASGEYEFAREVRTFSAVPRASQILDTLYADCANKAVCGELVVAFEKELCDYSKD